VSLRYDVVNQPLKHERSEKRERASRRDAGKTRQVQVQKWLNLLNEPAEFARETRQPAASFLQERGQLRRLESRLGSNCSTCPENWVCVRFSFATEDSPGGRARSEKRRDPQSVRIIDNSRELPRDQDDLPHHLHILMVTELLRTPEALGVGMDHDITILETAARTQIGSVTFEKDINGLLP